MCNHGDSCCGSTKYKIRITGRRRRESDKDRTWTDITNRRERYRQTKIQVQTDEETDTDNPQLDGDSGQETELLRWITRAGNSEQDVPTGRRTQTNKQTGKRNDRP